MSSFPCIALHNVMHFGQSVMHSGKHYRSLNFAVQLETYKFADFSLVKLDKGLLLPPTATLGALEFLRQK